jgi:colanic acid/amylovoran biosynthesis glycosyltransferase
MSKPVVVSYCADFLKADMQHIHRQITDLREWDACVVTHRRENEALFPFPRKKIRVLSRHPLRFFRRLWFRKVRGRQVPPTPGEVKQFLYQVMRFNARVVHIYFGHIAVRWLPMIRACPRPVVVSFHGADAAVGVTSEELREVFRCARLVLARSQALLDDLHSNGCPPDKLRLHRTGIPLDFWLPPPSPREIPPAGDAWRFVQAGRFIPKKGLVTTLRAFAEITRTHPNARLTLIGDGPQRPEIERLAADSGIASHVTLSGFLAPEAVREILHSAHLFIHPSETTTDGNREGVPNSLLEAMATGLPVLSTRHGGIPEAVDDGVSGFLVAERDSAALAAAALRLMAQPGQFAPMSAAARQAVMSGFERRAQTGILESIYDEAAGRP